jgi:pyruvate,water dikinase
MARYLMEQGIDSISLNPDSVVATARHLVEVERMFGIEPRAWQDPMAAGA